MFKNYFSGLKFFRFLSICPTKVTVFECMFIESFLKSRGICQFSWKAGPISPFNFKIWFGCVPIRNSKQSQPGNGSVGYDMVQYWYVDRRGEGGVVLCWGKKQPCPIEMQKAEYKLQKLKNKSNNLNFLKIYKIISSYNSVYCETKSILHCLGHKRTNSEGIFF